MILVTGAGGQLGSRILSELRAQAVAVVGGSRTPGEGMRHVDFDDPASLDLSGISTVVLVSAGYGEDDQVIARHSAAIAAAVQGGVGHLVYTSLTSAGDHLAFALAHRVTERLVTESGLSWTILRNGLYAELFGELLTWDTSGLESAFGEGAVSAVAREDLAVAAARVAAAPVAHQSQTYDLVGTPITAQDIADRLGVVHTTVSLSQYRTRLLAMEDLLPFQPPMLASIASSTRYGLLDNTSPDLSRLLGRAPTDALTTAIRAAVARRDAKQT